MQSSRILLFLFLPLVACDPPETQGRDPDTSPRRGWSPEDRPSLLEAGFMYRLDDLPTAGSADHIPWPGPYWPTYLDGINHRWAGADIPSPAEKYGQAFGVAGMEEAIAHFYGVDSVIGESCQTHTDCDLDLGYACGKRRGETSGRCIEAWFGICHAWAPAAVLEPEPTQPVDFNGVNFRVNDLKALISLAYTDDLEQRYVSLRCDVKGGDDGGHPECEDTNAGTFHVVVANLLGLRHQAFIEDRTYDYEVWNFPVFAFKVTQLADITAKQANLLLGGGPVVSTTHKQGKAGAGEFKQIASVPVAPGQHLRVRLSGTGDVDLYVRWDAAPTPAAYNCRPYIQGSNEQCELLVPPGVSHAEVAVNAYGVDADYKATIEVRAAAPDSYAYNPKAKSLRRVRTELSFVAESPPERDGPLTGAAEFTYKDIYDYVLELDGGGKIIGGEWVGASKINHPDFLWRPIKKLGGTVAGGKVSWSNVQKLLGGGGNPGGEVLLQQQGSVAAGEWKYYPPIELGAGKADATLTILSGDADLYVREGAKPNASVYDCRPYVDGDAPEHCVLTGPGTFHVAVYGWAAQTSYQLAVARQ